MGIKRADKRRMDEERVEAGVKEGFKMKLARNMLKWAGYVERIGVKIDKGSKCPESGGGKEVRKIGVL